MVSQRDAVAPHASEKYTQNSKYPLHLPPKLLDELLRQSFQYPGWQKDFDAAKVAFQTGSENIFRRALRKLNDKQQVYTDYMTFKRLSALAALDLSFPSHEMDKLQVERWLKTEPCHENTDSIFRDKVDGLRNKDQLFAGDRSHPNIKELDGLKLTYEGWEEGYRSAVMAHCSSPSKSFASHLHHLRQMEAISKGDRSHWRLVELDRLSLSYPGWKEDVAEIEEWHLKNIENEENKDLFKEVLEGLKDQERLYLQSDEAEERDTNPNI